MEVRGIISVLLVAALMSGCSRSTIDEVERDPSIAFRVDMPEAKSLIAPSNINTPGNRMKVYDVHTRTSPTEADQSGAGLFQYLDGQYLECTDGGGNWSFIDGEGNTIDIPWTKRGTHSFFAHNTYDASADQNLPVGVTYLSFEDDPALYLTEKDQHLSLSSWTITPENQFDFIYASAERDVMTSTDPAERYAPVQMSFSHLFASVVFRVLVTSSETVTLTSFSLDNMYNKGVATISFNGNVSLDLSYDGTNADFYRNNMDEQIKTGESFLVHAGRGKIGIDGAFLIWPHSRAQFADVSMSISYKLGSSDEIHTVQGKLNELFVVNNWAAGSRYTYTITIADEYVVYDVVEVVDWINNDVEIEER